jgi:hypothetical protein
VGLKGKGTAAERVRLWGAGGAREEGAGGLDQLHGRSVCVLSMEGCGGGGGPGGACGQALQGRGV